MRIVRLIRDGHTYDSLTNIIVFVPAKAEAFGGLRNTSATLEYHMGTQAHFEVTPMSADASDTMIYVTFDGTTIVFGAEAEA